MKKTIQQLLLLGGIILLFTKCEKEFFGNNCNLAEGPIVSQEIDLSTIHSLDIEIPVELIIQESAVQSITIESSQSVIDAILAESFVKNEEWNVQLDKCKFNSDSAFPVKITAALNSLQEIKLKGIGEARTEGGFKNIDHLKLEIEGSADFDFELDSIQSLETKLDGLGEFKLSGYAENYLINMNGSGEIKAFDLITNNCQISINGLGKCEVHVQESLEVKMDGSGSVCYKGQPVVNIDNSGNGKVDNCN